jgi:flagellar hook-length control protein FliK
MEVTNTNTNQFAPKLGQTASDTFSSDAFSTHLAETDTYASDDADSRRDDRNAKADDHRAEERQADAEKADAAAVEERRGDERERNADARSDDDAETDDDQDATGEDSASDVNLTAAEVVTPLDDDSAISEDVEIAIDAENGTIGDTSDSELTAGSSEETSGTVVPANAAADKQSAGAQTAATATDETTDPTANLDDTDTLTADELALQSAQASNNSATANADATAGSTAQQAARPVQNTTTQTAQQATQAAAGADDQSSGLPNPLDAALQTDVDADADGERGLGHQAAEAMAGKAKSSATNVQTPSAPQAIPAATPAAAAAVTPLQAMAAAGLNLSSLPADLNLDLLNLNAPNQVSPTGTPQNNNPVLVRFGALPGQAQATQVPNTAIALQISKHVARGVSTFEIRLDPAEMGRIDVKLELAQDGRVTAHLAVEKAETLDLLQKDAKALEQALKDAGLDADSDTLNFSLKSGNENADGNGSDTLASGEDQLGGDEDGEDVLLNAVAARQIEAAARGGIDVSI